MTEDILWWTRVAAAAYASVGLIYAVLTLLFRWYLVAFESRGAPAKATAISILLVLYCLVAWPLPMWQEFVHRGRRRRG
jgi:hypothetical protein